MYQDDLIAKEKNHLQDITFAPRTDPVYNAHGYLTKVPVAAIIPFIQAFTSENGIVVDMFAGSGMTAIAAKMAGRDAIVSDISELGKHIAEGYLTEVDSKNIFSKAHEIVEISRKAAGHLYKTKRESDGQIVEVVRTVWSFVYICQKCGGEIVYFEELAKNKWKAFHVCPHCKAEFEKKRAQYSHDIPVRVVVDSPSGRQVEQYVCPLDLENIKKAKDNAVLKEMPSRKIDKDREMYKRSALEKWNLVDTKCFFSARNAIFLTIIWKEINKIDDAELRKKLLFSFTAILPRASRRYQWSHKRPLNAANQNYYIAPVYYEWNVFELFLRKVNAVISADAEIRKHMNVFSRKTSKQKYVTCSADNLHHLKTSSVDYVFTDPPFGSNIFYSDMNLFQETWLGDTTNHSKEAVIHTTTKNKKESASQYEKILTDACKEAFRILKPGGCMSIIFGNSNGQIWSMFQRALTDSGFDPRPAHISILDKGQRSVKGLNSGTETVATLDLIVTIKKPLNGESAGSKKLDNVESKDLIESAVHGLSEQDLSTPSHVYVCVLKEAMGKGVSLESLHLADVLIELRKMGYSVNAATGTLERRKIALP